jgi:hypothetical protein
MDQNNEPDEEEGVVGVKIKFNAAQEEHVLELGSTVGAEYGLTAKIPVRSLVDLGDYVDPANGRTGHAFRLNGDTQIKILRWGDGFLDYPVIVFTIGDVSFTHTYDVEDLDAVAPVHYQPLVEYFQAHLIPEEPGAAGGRRQRKRSTRRRRRNTRRH